MADTELTPAFDPALAEYSRARGALAPLAARMALATVAAVLPSAHVLDLRGEHNEDWLPILRIARVLDDQGSVLFEAADGHDDPRVEAAINEANTEYLDLLIDLTGAEYLGASTIGGM